MMAMPICDSMVARLLLNQVLPPAARRCQQQREQVFQISQRPTFQGLNS